MTRATSGARPGRHAVGRDRRDDDVVDLGARAPGVVEREQAGARAARSASVLVRPGGGGARGCRCAGRSTRRWCPGAARGRALVMTCSGSAAPTPKMPAVMPRRRWASGAARSRVRRRVLGGWPSRARSSSCRLQGSLDEAGEDRAGPELDEALDAGGAQRQQRLAPAHGRAGGSRPARARTSRTAPRCRWRRRGSTAAGTGVAVERRAQALGRRLHQRRVEGAGDVEAPGAGAGLVARDVSASATTPRRDPRARAGRARCRWRRSSPRREGERAARRERRRRASPPCRRPGDRRRRPSRPRARRRGARRRRTRSAPAATSAAYSPSEWPGGGDDLVGVLAGLLAPLVPGGDGAQEERGLLEAGARRRAARRGRGRAARGRARAGDGRGRARPSPPRDSPVLGTAVRSPASRHLTPPGAGGHSFSTEPR